MIAFQPRMYQQLCVTSCVLSCNGCDRPLDGPKTKRRQGSYTYGAATLESASGVPHHGAVTRAVRPPRRRRGGAPGRGHRCPTPKAQFRSSGSVTAAGFYLAALRLSFAQRKQRCRPAPCGSSCGCQAAEPLECSCTHCRTRVILTAAALQRDYEFSYSYGALGRARPTAPPRPAPPPPPAAGSSGTDCAAARTRRRRPALRASRSICCVRYARREDGGCPQESRKGPVSGPVGF